MVGAVLQAALAGQYRHVPLRLHHRQDWGEGEHGEDGEAEVECAEIQLAGLHSLHQR